MHSVTKMTAGNFMHNCINANIIKVLDDEFDKFENRVKNCNDFGSLDTTVPVHIVKLFSKLFKIWSEVPELSKAMNGDLFYTVYSELCSFFEDDNGSDDDPENDEWCGNCLGLNAFAKFMGCMRDSVPSIFDTSGTATPMKGKNEKSLPGDEWLTEKNGFITCNVCNTKFSDMLAVFKHMNGVDHLKNYNSLRQNETFVVFPDEKSECFKCKLCKVEYSNLNSLVKHFTKPQHRSAKNNQTANPNAPVSEKKPSNCINAKTEVKSSTKVEYNQKFILSKGSGKFCQLCDKDLPAIPNVISHVKTSDHLAKLAIFESNQTYAQLSSKGDEFHCVLCGVSFFNLKALANHFGVKEHQRLLKLKAASESKPVAKPKLNDKSSKSNAAVASESASVAKSKPKSADKSSNVKAAASASESVPVTKPPPKSDVKSLNLKSAQSASQPTSVPKPKPKQDDDSLKVKAFPKPLTEPKPKSEDEKLINSVQLRDSDEKFVVEKGNVVTCILCSVELYVVAEIVAHVDGKSHLQNVHDFNNHKQYLKLPTKEINSFACTKCSKTCDSFASMLAHCKEHINPQAPKPKPQDTFQVKESDAKFIKKIGKSFRCNLCGKELPTQAAIVSHTESSTHAKNCNVFIKNSQYAKLPCKNGVTYQCTACQHEYNDLISLVKHFKDEAHNKTAFEGKKPKAQEPVHIPAHGKAKHDPILTPIGTPKSGKPKTPKKDRKHNENGKKNVTKTNTRSKTNQPVNGDVKSTPGSETVAVVDSEVYKSFPMKKTDNSYVVAKGDVFYCRLCDSDLRVISVAAHMNGATHRINVEVFETCESYARSAEDPAIECILCERMFDNIYEIVKHFKEKRHAKSGTQVTNGTEGIFGSTSVTPTTETPPKRVQINKCDRKHIFRLNGVIRCNLCDAKLVDFDGLEAHIMNLNHKRNSAVFLENESYIKQLDSIRSSFECTLCSFSSTLDQVIKHCKKKQHLKAKSTGGERSEDDVTPVRHEDVGKITENDRKCVLMKNGIVRCNLCHSKLPRESTLISHMSGQTHKQYCDVYKYNELYIEQLDEGYTYRCSLCDVTFSRLDTIIKHCMEEGHVSLREKEFTRVEANSSYKNVAINIATCDFECNLCAITFTGFANLAKHCCSKQHKILKSAIQPVQKSIPYHVTITDYQYHCYACNTRLHNKAAMRKHQNSPGHLEMEKFFKREAKRTEPAPAVMEVVGYVYSCSLCWLPMYSESELAEHEKTEMHKMGKNFDNVWKHNENHLNLSNHSGKVTCKLCDATFGIEKVVQHCTSRDHRKQFIANQMDEYAEDEHIIWKNATQYCNLCDCKLINDHNLINHVNSEGHKLKIENACASN